MIQYGPTTGQFADYRKTQKIACNDVSAALQKETGLTQKEANAIIVRVGLTILSSLVQLAKENTDSKKAADLLMDACLVGYGWTGLGDFYHLSDVYIDMLDKLNGMNVKDDNDLPPKKEST